MRTARPTQHAIEIEIEQEADPSSEAPIFYRALLTRDRRFDGRFFTGVLTTGIYCRPVCPADRKSVV